MDPRTKERIDQLIKQKYELRFPGGKSRDGSFACFGAVIQGRFHKGKIRYEVLVIPYKVMAKITDDEEKEKIFVEEPEQTLEREIQEETGIMINKGEYFRMNSLAVKDNRIGRENEIHTKHAYFIYRYDSSNFRTRISPYQKNIGTPFWIPIDHALEHYIAPSHLWIVKEIRRFLLITPVLKAYPSKRPQKKK